MPRPVALVSANDLQKQGLAAYKPGLALAGNWGHTEKPFHPFPRNQSQATMNFKFSTAAPALGDKAGKESKGGGALPVRLFRRLHSQWAASSAFFAAVLASLAAAAAVASSELPVLLGGL